MAKRIMVGLVALLCVAMVLGAVGCGSKDKGNPEQTVKDFWSALQKGDYAKAKTYLSSSIADTALADFTAQSDPMTSAMIEALMGTITLKTTGSSVDGDKATVDVEITMPDMDAVVEEMSTAIFENMGDDLANMNEEQMMEEFAKQLPKLIEEAPTMTEDSQVPLVWENDAWKIDASPFEDLEGF